ncbi:NAD-dependent epimerase/dehydratase family protein [Haloarcula marina]|uniref:NAD-dependent epimerase/dehydratase family protein n=1 Tax=Haloarcula marina TaxID=2961574 RepID=UPI0020B6D22C|nr:NAD-dependent epimerase/dehydratase family protein [Halomicroarcula marina]
MDVLVIGGTGIISTGITEQLVDADHDVTLYNRGKTDVAVPSKVELVRGDREALDQFELDMEALAPTAVVDMRCFTPAEARSAIRAFPEVERYVFCSTVAAYDHPVDSYPITETAERKRAGENYGEAKAECERIFDRAHEETGFPVVTLRPGHTYGEGGNRGGLCYSLGWEQTAFIDRLRRGLPIVVHDSGTSLWASCHRDDVAAAFVAALDNGETGEHYQVATETSHAWDNYLRRAARAIDAPEPELVHVPTEFIAAALPDQSELLTRDLKYSLAYDSSKAREALGFQPEISWADGFRRTVSWLDEQDEIDPAESSHDDELIVAWEQALETGLSAFIE